MELIRDLLTPSPRDESPATWLAVQSGHAMLGLAAVQVLGPWAWAFVLAYLLLKEGRDVWLGGSPADSAADAAFVALGAWWANPAGLLVVASVGALVRQAVRR